MYMLSNFELERLAEFYRLPLVTVCMKNELGKTVQDGCCIINLQSSTAGSGTHWCSMFINGLQMDVFLVSVLPQQRK